MEKDSITVNNRKLDTTQAQVDSDEDLKLWLHFIRDRRWSRRQKHQLLSAFQSPYNIYKASSYNHAQVITGRIKSLHKGEMVDPFTDETTIEIDLSWVSNTQAHIITFNSPDYPYLLRQIEDPPLALFGLGDLSLLNEPKVAIVGSRRPTPVGAKLSRQFAQELSALGLVITSGMALGIDGLSHQGALDQRHPTVAVMGCGLDVIYPARHKVLFERIKNEGLLISEYPLGVQVSRYTFPERNRIVSGLSLGVVIIEAAIKSGTLITARLAIEQNREVMVMPGSALSRQYQGSHKLLRDGAALVTSTKDILFILKDSLGDLSSAYEKEALPMHGNQHEDVLIESECQINNERGSVNKGVEFHPLLKLIGAEPVSVEALIMSSGLTPAQVSSMLLMLELEGKVAMSDDGGYINIG